MTQLLGLIGHPVAHSLSPPMHKAALLHFGIDGDYQLLDVLETELSQSVQGLVERGFQGFNITVPHKTALVEMCSSLTSAATACGAVNTVKIESGSLSGHNTDIGGFKSALQSAFGSASFENARVCVLGNGGAARGAVLALDELQPREILLVARNTEKAEAMLSSLVLRHTASRLRVIELPTKPVGERIDIIVQTTPIGLKGTEIPSKWLSCLAQSGAKQLFYDMVYSPDGKPTPLVAVFSALGVLAVDGTDMLVEQARLSFEFWTGKLPPFELMKSALEAARAERARQIRHLT